MNRIITTTALSLTALVAVAPVAGAAVPSHSPFRCDEGHWPGSVQAQPVSFSPGARAGYYIWHDGSGWHLRTTTPSAEGHTFAGKITASDNIKVLRVFKNEKADSVKLAGKSVSFRFNTHDHVDGFDFKVGCTESVKFAVTGEGRRWPAERIWLGATGTARTNPFTVSRVPAV